VELSRFAADVYSQFGEDGIVSEILDRIAERQPLSRWCVEFGAWDGELYSNTCNLIRNRGYQAVMIEGDRERVAQLHRNHPQSNVIKICAMVEIEGDNRLDAILWRTPLPEDFDVLSIDIDGYDYWVFKSLEEYRPKVVLIEFNPTIPNPVEYVQEPDTKVARGSSARSLELLAQEQGYGLVAATAVNLILVRRDLVEAVLGPDAQVPTLDQVRPEIYDPVYAFVGFDGSLLFSQPTIRFVWHGTSLATETLQPIPRFWRNYPGSWKTKSLRNLTWQLFRRRRGIEQ